MEVRLNYFHSILVATNIAMSLGQVVITGMTLIVDSDLNGASPQFTLTCISTGGPATTVTWTRDSVTVTEGSRTVLEDSITAQYTHNLTVTGQLGGLYTCSVSNNMPFTVNESFTVKGEVRRTCAIITAYSLHPVFNPVASAPTMLLAIQEGPTSVRVSWNSAVLQEDIKGYRLVYSNGGESMSVNVSSDQTGCYLVTELHNGEIYNIIFESISQHFNTNSSLNVPMGRSIKLCGLMHALNYSSRPAKCEYNHNICHLYISLHSGVFPRDQWL